MKKLFTFNALACLLCLVFGAEAQVVTITNGTSNSASAPLNHSNPYSANEMIYLQTQINQAGSISKIAFEKAAGANVSPVTNVRIYMKHTTASVLAAGAFDTTGYTRVYKGDFMNNATSGWMEIVLNTPFVYNNTSNLSIIFFKNNGSTASSQTYKYGFVSRLATRRASNATGITTATNLTTSDALPNLRLEFSAPNGLSKVAERAAFSLAPNPTSGLTLIKNAENASLIRVSDLTGKVVLSQKMQQANAELDLTKLPAGTYLVQVHAKNTVSVQRLVKQ